MKYFVKKILSTTLVFLLVFSMSSTMLQPLAEELKSSNASKTSSQAVAKNSNSEPNLNQSKQGDTEKETEDEPNDDRVYINNKNFGSDKFIEELKGITDYEPGNYYTSDDLKKLKSMSKKDSSGNTIPLDAGNGAVKGLKYFPNLDTAYLKNVSSIDSESDSLGSLNISSSSNLTKIDASKNKKLWKLTCDDCTSLTNVTFYNEGLGENPNDTKGIRTFSCKNCKKLTEDNVNIYKGTDQWNNSLMNLYIDNTNIDPSDWVWNSWAIQELTCSGDKAAKDLNFDNGYTYSYLSKLDCHDCNISNLVLSQSPKDPNYERDLGNLDCSNNHLTSLNVPKNRRLISQTFNGTGQTADADTYFEDSYYKVDFNKVVVPDETQKDNIKNVILTSENWEYNKDTGIATYSIENTVPKEKLEYSYDMGYNGFKLDVTLTLKNPNCIITYLENDGSTQACNPQTVEIGKEFTLATQYSVPAGQTSDGNWYADQACTQIAAASGEKYTVDKDTTLYAGSGYKLIQDLNYEGQDPKAYTLVLAGHNTVEPADPHRDGYDFKGWYKDAACTEKYQFGSPITEDTTIYAKWEKQVVTCTVTFDSNGGSPVESQSVIPMECATRPENPTNGDEIFAGWYDEDGNLFNFNTPITKDTELRAEWKTKGENEAIVNFENVTPEQDPAQACLTQVIEKGKTATVPNPMPIEEGSVFAGWQNSGELFDFTTPITEDVDLQAQWQQLGENEHVVSFDLNGLSDTKQEYLPKVIEDGGVLEQEQVQTPIWEGRVFLGWYKYSEYEAGGLYNFEDKITYDVTLKAHWKDMPSDPRTVTFDLNGGKDPGQTALTQIVQNGECASKPLEGAPPQKEGYTFKGWYIDNATFENEYDFKTPVTENITLHAKWNEKFKVTFDSNGGTPTPDVQVITDGDCASRPVDPTKEEYVFAGWYDKDGNLFNFETKITEDITLTAQWNKVKANEHIVSFDLNGGIDATQSCLPQIVKDGESAIRPTDPVPDMSGYVFNIWEKEDSSYVKYDFRNPVTDNLTLRATFLNYNDCGPTGFPIVVFNLNGGNDQSQSCSPQFIGYNDIEKPSIDPVKEGYKFTGWYYDNGTTQFDFEHQPFKPYESSFTLYAHWEENPVSTCTVTYVQNDGTTPACAATTGINPGDSINLPTEYQVPDKQTSDNNWYTDKDCKTEPIAAGSSYTVNSDTTLYAGSGYKLTQDLNYEGQPDPKAYTLVLAGHDTVEPADPKREGYDFKGWYKDAACTEEYQFGSPIEQDTIIYAKWAKTFELQFKQADGEHTANEATQVAVGDTITLPTPGDAQCGTYTNDWYSNPDLADEHKVGTAGEEYTIKEGVTTLYAGSTNKVAFDTNGGTPKPEAKDVLYGHTIDKLPTNPSKPGLDFLNWYSDKALTKVFDINTQIKGEITLYAGYGKEVNETNFPDENFRNFVKDKYCEGSNILTENAMNNVKIMECDGKEIKDLTGIKYFKNLTELNCSNNYLTSLDTNGLDYLYNFAGNGQESTANYTFDTADNKYKVNIADVIGENGNKNNVNITKTSENNWDYSAETGVATYEGTDVPTKLVYNYQTDDKEHRLEVTLTLPEQKLKVTFDSNGGTDVPNQSVILGQTAVEPTKPTKEGFNFKGWYIDNGTFEKEYDFKTPVTQNINLYAKWEEIADIDVTLHLNDGTGTKTIKVKYDSTVGEIDQPTYEGHKFAGWYYNEACTQAAKYEDHITKTINLYAKWDIYGIYKITTKLDDNYALDIAGGSKENGANVQIWKNGDQKFKIEKVGDYYKIIAMHSGKAFDVTGGGQAQGTNLQQYDYNGSNAQLWTIEKQDDGSYTFKSKCNNKYINVSGGQVQSGQNVWLYSENPLTNASKFNLTLDKGDDQLKIDNKNFVIQSGVGNNQVLDIANASKEDGANLQIYTANDSLAQTFKFVYQGSGYYKIISVNSGKALDVSGGSSQARTNVQQWGYSYVDAQLWKITKDDKTGNYEFEPKCAPGMLLDVNDVSSKPGTNVQIYNANHGVSQKFTLSERYNIETQTNNGGVITGDTWAKAGEDRTYTIKPDNIHDIYKVTLDGKDITNDLKDGKYTLSNINANHKMVATFKLKPNAQIEDGTYTIKTQINTNYVLDIAGGSKENGANVQIWQYDQNAMAQKYKIEKVGDYYKIIAMCSGKSLDVQDMGTTPGTNLQQYAYNGNDAQLWTIIQQEDGSYIFVSKCNGLCINVSNGQAKNGQNVWMWNDESDASKFNLTLDKGDDPLKIDNKNFVIQSGVGHNQVLDIANASKEDGANLQISTQSDGTNLAQIFKVIYQGSGYYKIISANSGKALDVSGGSSQAHTNVQQWGYSYVDAQLWKITKDKSNNYEFEPKCAPGMLLDVNDVSSKPGTNVQIYNANHGVSQKFTLSERYNIETQTNNGGVITGDTWAKAGEDRTLTIKPDNIHDIDKVTLDDKDITNDLQDGKYTLSNINANHKMVATFKLKPNAQIEEGIYTIKTQINTNYVLDIKDGSKENRANVQIWEYNKNAMAQKYKIEKVGDYYKIIAMCSGKALDVQDMGTTPGTNLQQYDYNGNDAQLWTIIQQEDGSYIFVSKCNDLCINVFNGQAKDGQNVQLWNEDGSNAEKFKLVKN